MKETNEIIMFNDDKAAKYYTDLKGWVSGKGHFYGESEDIARYDGCTHVKCKECEKVTLKHKSYCDDCKSIKERERYLAMPEKEYSNEIVYSESHDRYFTEFSDIQEFIDDNEEDEITIDSLMLVSCEPQFLPQIDESWCEDIFPEDCNLHDVAPDIYDALESLNELIRDRKEPVSWYPDKFRIVFKSGNYLLHKLMRSYHGKRSIDFGS